MTDMAGDTKMTNSQSLCSRSSISRKEIKKCLSITILENGV